MSVWTTKSLDRDRDYIVLKHSLPVNTKVMGVKFREGYAVVENQSKIYFQLKQIPLLKTAREYPLTFLKKLPFITRSADVRTIYGQDVYRHYTDQLVKELEMAKIEEKAKQEEQHINNGELCTFRNMGHRPDDLCKNHRLKESPSGHCFKHLLHDPKLDVTIPMAMTPDDKKKLTLKVLRNIEKYTKGE